MKLVADINIPYLKGVLDPYFDQVLLLPAKEITPEIVKDADALLIRTRTFCNADLLDGSKVKFIGSATIGFDHIDTNYCKHKGIEWVNAPGCNAGAVQQWVAAALLHLSKKKSIELKGKVLGVVGVGNVGKRVVELGNALGMKVLCCDPPRKRTENLIDYVDIETIAKQSDFMTFHVPLSSSGADATLHMVNSTFLNSLKSDVVLLNSSRGEVVDTNALIDAIQLKKVNAVALDVWENEPNISLDLLKIVDIATPHIAGYSLEGKVNGTRMVVDSLSQHFKLKVHPWFPKPNPTSKKELLDKPKSLTWAIEKTYSIIKDDKQLRNDPNAFEQLRSDYKLRREFSGYNVIGVDKGQEADFQKIGFNFEPR